jgi:hypothetical protein
MMINRARSVTFALLVGVVGLTVTGCGTTTEEIRENVQQSVQAACDQRVQTQESLDALRALDLETASVDDIEAAVGDVRDDLQALRGDLGDVRSDLSDRVENAEDNLEEAVDGLDDETLPEVRAGLETAIDRVDEVWGESLDVIECE